jgi:sugar transferase (PEP-CTERM/EpsH1 system associated)
MEYFHSTSMAKRIKQAVESESYHAAFVFGSSMAHFVEPWPQIPTILDLVDVDSDKWTQYSLQSSKALSWLWRLEGKRLEECESNLVQRLANTLVCTDAEARLLRRKAPIGKISVLQNSLDTEYFQPDRVAIPEEIRNLQPYVIFTGTMDYFPNVDAVQYFVKDVFPVIRSQVPNASFVIAGRSPGPEVRRLAEDPAIHITGAVPDIRPYLQGAAVAVAPMRIARGVQNKILEALAMDVSIVSSAAAANALPPDLAVLLATESEPRPFADRVVAYLLNAPERTGFLRSSIKSYIDNLDLPSQLEQLLRAAVVTGSNTTPDERIEVAV